MEELLVHGHSCCEIRTDSTSFICDPWLLGSAYWRSWWNFPEPVDIPNIFQFWKEQANVYIYISHLHWDHFHGPTIRELVKQVNHAKFIIPLTPERRVENDLLKILPIDIEIIKAPHAKKILLEGDLNIMSFQSGFITSDSAISIKTASSTILNLNDSKIFRNSMKHLLSKIDSPDYVLRSHSSANSRCCIRITGEDAQIDKCKDDYSMEFLDSCYATNGHIAIPFASNMAHLHRDTFKYNEILNFADNTVEYYQKHSLKYPGMRCMQVLPGESIDLKENKLKNKRQHYRDLLKTVPKLQILKDYQDRKAATLDMQYEREMKARPNIRSISNYFSRIMKSTPLPLRWFLSDHVCLEITSGLDHCFLRLDFKKKSIIKCKESRYGDKDITIVVDAFVINDVCSQYHWNSLGVSKRLKVIQSKQNKTFLMLSAVCNSIESGGILSIRSLFNPRTIRIWASRRREFSDIIELATIIISRRGFNGKLKSKALQDY